MRLSNYKNPINLHLFEYMIRVLTMNMTTENNSVIVTVLDTRYQMQIDILDCSDVQAIGNNNSY